MPSARSGTSSGDAAVGTKDAVNAAWEALQEETRNAWKAQG
jgi:hypothetical protein